MEHKFWSNVARVVTIAGLTLGSAGCGVPVNPSPTGEDNSPKSTEIAPGDFGPVISTAETIANLPAGSIKDNMVKRLAVIESFAQTVPGYIPDSVMIMDFTGQNGPFEYAFASVQEDDSKKTVVVEYADKNKAEDLGGADLLAEKQTDGSTVFYFNQGANPIPFLRSMQDGSTFVYDPTGIGNSTTPQEAGKILSTLFGYTNVQAESLPTPTNSPTLKPTPTHIVMTPTITATPFPIFTSTPEITKINEKELDPAYTETVSQKYMGVQINAELITDKSVDPIIKKVTVPPSTYAEFIARSMFKVWWIKSPSSPKGPSTEKDFTNFMALWSKAQETNNPSDWAKIQLDNIWANDLNDGNGYVQKPYSVWPMFTGQAPDGVKGISNISIALVSNTQFKDITVMNNELNTAYGTNLNSTDLLLYAGSDVFSINADNPARLSGSVSGNVASAMYWLITNKGLQVNGFIPNSAMDLDNILERGGLTAN